jgi:hypothetical protein
MSHKARNIDKEDCLQDLGAICCTSDIDCIVLNLTQWTRDTLLHLAELQLVLVLKLLEEGHYDSNLVLVADRSRCWRFLEFSMHGDRPPFHYVFDYLCHWVPKVVQQTFLGLGQLAVGRFSLSGQILSAQISNLISVTREKPAVV